MRKLLSQEEVDSLLKGISDGEVETEKQVDEAVSGHKRYDFTNQDRIIRGRYYLVGKVIATGRKRNVVVDLMKSTVPDKVVFSFVHEAANEEAIPEALEKIADEIQGFLGLQRSEDHLKEIRRKRLAQLCPLNVAVDEAEKAVEANPDGLSLRLLLLSFYAEDRSAYGDRVRKVAGEIVRAWDSRDIHAKQISYELGVDPFLLLCEEQERNGDWSGVLQTARLGMDRHPLRAAAYRKWELKAEEHLRRDGETQ